MTATNITWPDTRYAVRIVAAGLLCIAGIGTASAGSLLDAQTRYREEKAACMQASLPQDRGTCLHEAGAALQEAKRSRFGAGSTMQYEQNVTIRCNALPAEDREDCGLRMRGEGLTKGSVREGGIYRDLSRTIQP